VPHSVKVACSPKADAEGMKIEQSDRGQGDSPVKKTRRRHPPQLLATCIKPGELVPSFATVNSGCQGSRFVEADGPAVGGVGVVLHERRCCVQHGAGVVVAVGRSVAGWLFEGRMRGV
jgi:hypothetical protein